MKIRFGVDSFIWSEVFSEKDLWIIPKAEALGFETIDIAIAHPFTFPTEKVKAELEKTNLEVVTTTTLGADTNLISEDAAIRRKGIDSLKKLVDINLALGSNILGGVNYAGWGCLSGKPKTEREWKDSVEAMREVGEYALKKHPKLKICVEPVNRFETHFINTAEDGVKYCKDVGTGNMAVHLDCFHMIREETSYTRAVETCGKEYLGYVHVCESNRGIPGTGLVPFKEFFIALKKVGYEGPCVIESFDPSFEELNANCAIWRKFADTGEDLAVQGLANLKKIAMEIE
ncbi:D-psicose/D-tagatose/L-ribulose 3-epimerase [Breznakia sp. PF5-3]|uniref:sugar phosphate isomerase/epimerase family protein n=1 Tax=unclassified Breznakia TaxID=2623764 RepID=UPI002404E28B|nr:MULTISPECIES: sugar phosphate isomerase/epimerase family protein [unclassified Breznakia]MDL2276713.1 sugar phosphate isomerase/epimerase [Breznakia sp. OttesenSCG-928-G09]MDF9824351.1 D-psicose/D-tagatose/L-ribulose 3-epimerase [Breznakia sp. PM6-1]MDF9835058.1 D-psicose/D-tagatose/L-ribulose 3-epimerase [Breznakia sp. PF5-3]MDF9837771.1 D-psicose/D-tagatose/L-ribulose 3-epimerase [Breznakia sp. PFB2-8]MDF9859650.1 D-psicose/D-tagatose/L-ribulose 3-epimerase [Breznakia sp. PH5-24]